jgi:hypothetical protein
MAAVPLLIFLAIMVVVNPEFRYRLLHGPPKPPQASTHSDGLLHDFGPGCLALLAIATLVFIAIHFIVRYW